MAPQQPPLQEPTNRSGPITRKLPTELLSAIFRFACPPINFTTRNPRLRMDENHFDPVDEHHALTILAAVSSLWRQIALHTPQLWSSMAITVRKGRYEVDRCSLQRKTALLKFYLEQSKSLPFSLELNLPWDMDVFDSDVAAIISMILSNGRRFKLLHLSNPPGPWIAHYITGHRGFLQIEDFRLGFQSADISTTSDIPLNLSSFHHLRRLSLKGVFLGLGAPFDQITTLRLFYCPLNICIDTLIHCPNIIEFRARNPCMGDTDPKPSSGPLVFPHLKIFEWAFHENRDSDPSIQILRHLTFPAIETLGISGHGISPDFFKSLPSQNVKTLELNLSRVVESAFVATFSHFPNVTTLALHDVEHCLLPCVFDYLIPVSKNAVDIEKCLPHLDTMIIDEDLSGRIPPFRELPSRLLKMLGGRCVRMKLMRLRVDLELGYDIIWGKSALGLKDLVQRRGIHLEIFERGRAVSFLGA